MYNITVFTMRKWLLKLMWNQNTYVYYAAIIKIVIDSYTWTILRKYFLF